MERAVATTIRPSSVICSPFMGPVGSKRHTAIAAMPLDRLGVDLVGVAAHDWSALVGLVLAALLPQRVDRLAVFSVGHPQAFAGAGFIQKQLSWYMLWWQFEGVAEAQLPEHDWRWYREWAYDGIARADDPDLDRQLTDLERPGALTAGLNWYRANMPPEDFARTESTIGLPPVACEVLGVWVTAKWRSPNGR
jgi:pimeloyl-ACP methyl ester carboxylesterase